MSLWVLPFVDSAKGTVCANIVESATSFMPKRRLPHELFWVIDTFSERDGRQLKRLAVKSNGALMGFETGNI